MLHPVLNNPVWSALTSEQAHFAIGNELARRYPAQVAPFIAVAEDTPACAAALSALVTPGEIVCGIGVLPRLGDGWRSLSEGEVGQLVHPSVTAPPPAPGDEHIHLLQPADETQMNQLTALVYPGFFRPGTARMGDYYGLHENGQLTAMAGERMRLTGYQEISAVCTHPQFTGRGLAARLINHLVARIIARGQVGFLHVEADNQRAWALYERLGFRLRATLPLWKLQRLPAD